MEKKRTKTLEVKKQEDSIRTDVRKKRLEKNKSIKLAQEVVPSHASATVVLPLYCLLVRYTKVAGH